MYIMENLFLTQFCDNYFFKNDADAGENIFVDTNADAVNIFAVDVNVNLLH